MKVVLVSTLAAFVLLSAPSIVSVFAEQGTFVDMIQFVQYIDENTALEEVKNKNLDLYYYRIPSERIESPESREGLKVYQSTGGSYSLLVNPAESSEKFNPFSITEVRFALNYLVDRKLIVNELMGGYGMPMISNYGPFDPDYLAILNELESFNFRYNPALAEQMISDAFSQAGVEKIDGKWNYNSEPIEIIFFIRSDDHVRKSIGEIISSQLEQIGFIVKKDYGDLNKAFVVVYGSNPANLEWSLYTEGWGRSGFVRYDSAGLAQMYAPWFSNMPGFGDPSYWNYENEYLDSVTQKIYVGDFVSPEERIDLFKQATNEAVKESVRIFLAAKIDQYVSNDGVDGIINDFGAGVPSRFTPINARTDSNSLTIGVKQIYQGAWNPVAGLSDTYSRQIWDIVSDPGVFKHPYKGTSIPIRSYWVVETAGPNNKLDVPSDVIRWDTKQQNWIEIGTDHKATSKVTFDLLFANWHHGKLMDMNDILYSLYFVYEWGSDSQEDDRTHDNDYSPQANQLVKTLVGVKIIDENTIDVYVDFWHFDEDEIADWAGVWASIPWEIFSAMEHSVIDGKVSFSRSGSVSKNVNWLSLLVPNDASLVKSYLEEFKETEFIPSALEAFSFDTNYHQSRYDSSISWIEQYDHAIISNGPFYMERYSPESRTITIRAFDDVSYPFEAGHWQKFEDVRTAKIVNVDVPKLITKGDKIIIPVSVSDSSNLFYYFTNPEGQIVASDMIEIKNGNVNIVLSEEQTTLFGTGANDMRVFAISEEVFRPDVFSTSFLVVNYDYQEVPVVEKYSEIIPTDSNNEVVAVLIGIVVGVIAVAIGLTRKRSWKRVRN
ncbi:MAG: ABC transporter substrate-binding protein [Thaumarchaeota archaeon]|nr:ABC transporter substrate-binding protein [Nitrososphaerota archaeon]